MNSILCAYCGRPFESLHHDHVVPRSRGGPDTAFNIVMACEPCNLAKSGRTAIEWLDERCPEAIRAIEERVNRRLKKRFAMRDKKQPQAALFCYHLEPCGEIGALGKVIRECETTVRVEVFCPLHGMAGIPRSTGMIVDLPTSECVLFSNWKDCLETAVEISENLLKSRGEWEYA